MPDNTDNSMFNEDLFPSSSIIDLLQTAPDVGMTSYIITEDDDNLELPTMLPNLLSAPMSPTDASVNVLDMVSQDMLLENSFGTGATTEMTYASQYEAAASSYCLSAAPFTSAGDVFLPSLAITTASNTFVKPLHMYTGPPTSLTAKPIPKPTPRLDSRPAKSSSRSDGSKSKSRSDHSGSESRSSKSKSGNRSETSKCSTKSEHRKDSSRMDTEKSTTRYENAKSANTKAAQQTSKAILDQSDKRSDKNTSDASLARTQPPKTRCSSGKIPTKSNKAHTLHDIIKSLNDSLASRHSAHLKGKSVTLIHSPQQQNLLVAAPSPSGKARSTVVTHTVTRPTIVACEAAIDFTTETETVTTTVSHTISHQGCVTSSLITTAVTSYTTRTQSPVTSGICTRASVTRSYSLTTSTLASYTASKPRAASVTSPIQNAHLPASMLYTTPTIISRKVAGGEASPSAVSPPCERAVPGGTRVLTPSPSPTGAEDAARRPPTRLVVPVTMAHYASGGIGLVTTAADTKPRIDYHPLRPAQNIFMTTMYTRSTTTTAMTTALTRTLTPSTFTLPPGATLYAARKISSSRSIGSRDSPINAEPQTFAFVDKKGTYTTLTIAGDLTTTGGSLALTQTTHTATAGVASHTQSVARSQLIIPIANSQINTSTSFGYLVTSPIAADLIAGRNSAGAGSAHGGAAAAPTLASHTITTISSEALNRLRNRILMNDTSTLRQDDDSMDASRTPVSIIANQLVAGPISRDVPMADVLGSSQISTATRALLSASGSQGMYAIGTRVTSPSPTGAAESATRRVLVPVSSNSQSDATTVAGPIAATRGLPAVPTPGTSYIIATGMASSPVRSSMSSRILLPTVHATIAMTSSTVATTMSRTFQGTASRTAVDASQICATDAQTRLRNQMISQVPTTASCMQGPTTPITAYAIAKSRAPHMYAISAGAGICKSAKKHAEMALSPATMTLITFPSSSAASTGAHSPLTATTTTVTTAVATSVDSDGDCRVLKIMSPAAAQSSVTGAVVTPITSAAVRPPEHQFLEPRQMCSRLRACPAPRTYSVAERAAANPPPRPAVRNVCPKTKKCVSTPGPLQIFADVVCPPTTVQTRGSTSSQSTIRFPLARSNIDSTLGAAHNKGAVFKNMISLTRGRPGSRLPAPGVSTERVALLPPQRVALVPPRAATATRPCPRFVRPALPRPAAPPTVPTPSAPESPEPKDWAIPSPERHPDTNH